MCSCRSWLGKNSPAYSTGAAFVYLEFGIFWRGFAHRVQAHIGDPPQLQVNRFSSVNSAGCQLRLMHTRFVCNHHLNVELQVL